MNSPEIYQLKTSFSYHFWRWAIVALVSLVSFFYHLFSPTYFKQGFIFFFAHAVVFLGSIIWLYFAYQRNLQIKKILISSKPDKQSVRIEAEHTYDSVTYKLVIFGDALPGSPKGGSGQWTTTILRPLPNWISYQVDQIELANVWYDTQGRPVLAWIRGYLFVLSFSQRL